MIRLGGVAMSNMHMKEKVYQLVQASKKHSVISHSAKTFGFKIFLVCCSIGILFLLFLTVSLFFYGRIIVGLLMSIATCAITYFLVKISTAEDLPKDDSAH